MKFLNTLIVLLMITNNTSANKANEVSEVLDNLHKAASQADSKVYFNLFTNDANFIGTDVGEYWNINEFKAFVIPYFEKGQGWTYIPRNREIKFNDSETVAWFHEILDNNSYGTTRGTGVLIFHDNNWKISQYHLTIPIPNDLAKDFTTKIKSFEASNNKKTKGHE